MMKKCNSCGENKKLEEYNKDVSKGDGRRGQCKVCWRLKKKIHKTNVFNQTTKVDI